MFLNRFNRTPQHEMQAEELITKAAQTAELLVQDLRELHRAFCSDKPTSAERLAEQHALGLLNQGVQLHRELKGLSL
jgi:hypothetical protein